MTKRIKVLMVDDEAQFRETTSKILTRKGYEVTMVGSGEEAIDILKEKPQDVVILDIRMPGIDGHEALSRIKEIRTETQVIMLTGHGADDSARESLNLGAYDYLTKPCDIDLLAARINGAYVTIPNKAEKWEEKLAGDVMIRVSDYTTIMEDKTIKEAIQKLMQSFEGLTSSSRIMETSHRSILVFDKKEELVGILSIQDLIEAVRPAYLSTPMPSMADSIRYSPMFWRGLFTTEAKALAGKKVGDVMSESPPRVDKDTNLMKLADIMNSQQVRRMVVTKEGKVVGVVREQELFFEMANITI